VRALISVVGIALLAAGCFDPHVKTGGFACDPTVQDACPTGFFCVNQRCVDHPGTSDTGGNGGGDMSVDNGDMSMTTPPSGSDDLSQPPTTPADLAQPIVPPDMAKPIIPPDLTPPDTCEHDQCTDEGDPLTDGCNACVTAVCAKDAYCCQTDWDSKCISEVAKYCTTESCP
jgi:hypothetical protein